LPSHKMYKIVAFGDSTTAPRTVEDRALTVYTDILAGELAAAGIAAQIINRGVPGNTTEDATARFEPEVLAENADLVIIQFGINDAAVDVWENPPKILPRVRLEDFDRNLENMIERIAAQGGTAVLMTPNVTRWTPLMLEYYGKPPYDRADPMGFNVVLRDYAQRLREIAVRRAVTLVDVYQKYCEYPQRSGRPMDELLLDGMHPNDAGHRLVAAELMDILRKRLRKHR